LRLEHVEGGQCRHGLEPPRRGFAGGGEFSRRHQRVTLEATAITPPSIRTATPRGNGGFYDTWARLTRSFCKDNTTTQKQQPSFKSVCLPHGDPRCLRDPVRAPGARP